MLIYHQQLKELAKYRKETDESIVSLYLNIAPPEDYKSRLNSMIRTTRNELKNRPDKDRFEAMDRLFADIEKHAENTFYKLKNTRLVVIFADASGFWQEYRLPVSLPGELTVEPDPYIRPLTTLLDEFDRYLVLVADSRHARLFSLYLGDFEEHPDVFMESDVPDRVRVNVSMASASGSGGGGAKVYQGLGDKRIEGHIKDHIHKHLKFSADKTFEYFREKEFTRLIIGTPDDKVRPWLRDHLHSYLKDRLAGEFNARPAMPDHELKNMALETAAGYERENEKRMIDTLFEKSNAGSMAVLGIDPVIRALRRGQVHTLVVENGYKTAGYLCLNDHNLSTVDSECPLCGAAMTEVSDILDEMVEEAILHNSEVKHVFTEHPEFGNYHAGAILRFSM